MTDMKIRDNELVLLMAGKILAAIAGSTTNAGSQTSSALGKARDILKEVDSKISQPAHHGVAQMRNSIAEIAATIYAAQLAKSSSSTVPSNGDENPVKWAIALAQLT